MRAFALFLLCQVTHRNLAVPLGSKASSDICNTKECLETAEYIRNSINSSVDPCDDFYEYTCGNWKRNNPIPGHMNEFTQFTVAELTLDKNVREILSAPIGDNDPEHLRKVKAVITSCLDLDAINARGISPLIKVVEEYGGWPIIQEKWDPSGFDPSILTAKLQRNFAKGYLFKLSVETDVKNAGRRIILLDQPDFFIGRDFLLGDDFKDKVEAYRNFTRNVVTELRRDLGLPEDEEGVRRQVQDLVEFEQKLAKISATDEAREDATLTYNLYTNQDFQKLFLKDQVDWLQVLNTLFENIMTLPPSEKIIVSQPSYIKELFSILASTEPVIIANYLQWRVVSTFIDDVTNKLRDISFEYKKISTGLQEPEKRDKTCIKFNFDDPLNPLGYSISSEYIKKYFLPEDKAVMEEMITFLISTFEQFLDEATWMDAPTKAKAFNKIQKMGRFVGYPNLVADEKRLAEFYADLHPKEGHHLENLIFIKKWSQEFKDLKKLRDAPVRDEMPSHAVIVNAYNDFQMNTINFPAGLLVTPWYRQNVPRYLNYGSMGVVIGHEITHGFDTTGSQYNEIGSAVDWWSPNIKEQFNAKAQCFKDQYGNFTTPAGNVNPILTSGENIGDNGGLRQSFQAYKNWVRDKSDNQPEPKIQGLEEFDQAQLFFLNFANLFCYNNSPEKAQELLHSDPHSPFQYRTVGALQNSHDFATAFNCAAGSKMNRTDKCLLW